MASGDRPTGSASQRAFVARQHALRQFINDVEHLPLTALLPDPLVLHTVADHAVALKEERTAQRIERTVRRLARLKKRGANISAVLEELVRRRATDMHDPSSVKASLEDQATAVALPAANGSLFPLQRIAPPEKTLLQAFKEDLPQIRAFAAPVIEYAPIPRAVNASSAHSQFLKKLERVENVPGIATVSSNEITAATSFRNGILKPGSAARSPSPTGARPPRQELGSAHGFFTLSPRDESGNQEGKPRPKHDT